MNAQVRERVRVVIADYDDIAKIVARRIATVIEERRAEGKTPVMLYKMPGCEFCNGYAEYLRGHGFAVTVKATEKLAEISRNAGIPTEMQGCHTSFIDGYVIDGPRPYR